MPYDALTSRFLRKPTTGADAQILRYSVGALLGAGALCAGELLGASRAPFPLICTFAVLISALAGGQIAGWLCLGITSIGYWFLPSAAFGFNSSHLTVWGAYVALGIVLIEVIRHMQQERRKLLEQDQRLRLAGRAAHIWFWEWDLSNNLLRWSREKDSNDGHTKYYEFPLELYINRRVHPEDRQRILTALFESAARGERFELEYRIIEEDGTLHWLSTKGKIFSSNGTTSMLGMASEITEQKLASEVRSHYRAVLGSLIEGVCYVDTSGAIQYANAAAERMLGYKSDELEGRNFHELVHLNCHSDVHTCCLLENMQSERSCHIQEETLTTKAGEKLAVEYTAAPVVDTVTLGAVVTFRDISERKRAEAALRSSEKLAATGRMAATISHELRNPLDSVMQLLYLLKQSPRLTETERGQFELVEQELRRMTEVTQQTLAMHRQSSSMVAVNLPKLLDGVLLLYGKKIHSQKIMIDRRYDWRGEVPGFPAELRQVFGNLIVNAVEAMPQGGSLRMHVRGYREPAGKRREGVLVALFDSGTGIPRGVRRSIFEPFFTTKGEKGSGVGLWVSRGIVERHGGHLRVHSDDRPGRSYTCFSLFLPAKQPQRTVEEHTISVPKAPPAAAQRKPEAA